MSTGSIHDNFQYFAESPLRHQNANTDGPWWPVDLFDPDFGNQYGDGSSSASWRSTLAAPPTRRRRATLRQPPDLEPGEGRRRERTTAGSTRLRRSRRPSPLAPTRSRAPRRTSPTCLPRSSAWANAKPAAWYKDGDQFRPLDSSTCGFITARGDSGCAELADVPLRRTTTCSSNPDRDLVDYRLHAPFPAHRGARERHRPVLNNERHAWFAQHELGPRLSISGRCGSLERCSVRRRDRRQGRSSSSRTTSTRFMQQCSTHNFSEVLRLPRQRRATTPPTTAPVRLSSTSLAALALDSRRGVRGRRVELNLGLPDSHPHA